MIRLTRRYRFSASHRLHSACLSDTENRELYGKCSNPHGHGHDYVLEVSLRGPIDPASGRVADVAALDRLVGDHVLRVLDHKNLNVEVPEFATAVPTTENLGFAIRDRIKRGWEAAFSGPWPRLERIRIQETKRNTFEIRNEE